MLSQIVHINSVEQRTLVYTNGFERTLRKLIRKQPNLANLITNTFELLIQNPFNPTLSTHKIIVYGDEKVWSSLVNFSIRVLWKFDEQRNIVLRSIGTHDAVY